MLKPSETTIKPRFLEKSCKKKLNFLKKNAKIWIFPQFLFKTLKNDKIYPNELRSRLYKVLNTKEKAHNVFKNTETSNKSQNFWKKMQKF